MRVTRRCEPSYTIAYVQLEYEESILAISGAVAMMSAGIHASIAAPGGLTRSYIRRRFGDESFFMGRYTAKTHDAWVALAPTFPGDVHDLRVSEGNPLFIEAGNLLAYSEGITIDVKYAGLRNIVLHEGATVLHARGAGDLLLSAYGGVEHFELGDGDPVVVDTGHLVAWSESCGYAVGPLGGIIGSQLNGEGLVGQITGPGDLWVQTRAEQDFRRWLLPGREPSTGRGATRN